MIADNIKTPDGWIQNSLSMEGNERAIINAIVAASNATPLDRPFTYLEIGIFRGGTVMAACTVIGQLHRPATVIGLDIKDWGASAILQPWLKLDSHPRLFLPIGGRERISELFESRKCNVAFIDACHCRPCAIKDFEAIEPFMASGGRVIFHDASPPCQGAATANCEGSDGKIWVREALSDLGLLPCTRKGWRLEADLVEVPHGVTVYAYD